MDDTRIPPAEPGAALLRAGGLSRPAATTPDLHGVTFTGGRVADAFYTDYPSVGPDRPEYEPRGPADCSEARPGVFPDPHDRAVRRAAEQAWIPYDRTTAARRSPVHALIGKYRVALPLHPEYRSPSMVPSIPPPSPVVDALTETGR